MLFRTHIGHFVIALTKSLYFKGNLISLAVCHPPGHCGGHSSYAFNLYLLKGQLLGLVPKLGHQCSDWREVSAPMSQDVEDSEDCPRLLQVNPNAPPHDILILQGLIHVYPPLNFPLLKP